MNCQEFENELTRCVEEKCSPSSQAREHAMVCTAPNCQQQWEEFQILEVAIVAWADALPQIDLTDHLLSLHDQALTDFASTSSLPTSRNSRQQAMAPDRFPAAMAAVVSLLVTACLLVAISIRPATTPSLASSEVVNNQPRTEEEELVEIGAAYADLMHGAASRMTSTISMVIPARASVAPERDSVSSLIDTWSKRFEPLEEKLNHTVQDFVEDTRASEL